MMAGAGKMRFTFIMFGLLLASNLKGNEVWLDVSSDSGLPWAAFSKSVFPVGLGNNVHFSTSATNYTGANYTTTSSGMYFSALGWTNIYTLLAPNANPIVGAYLAITVSNDASVSYRYTVNPTQGWNIATSTFTTTSSNTWASVANMLFPPPPPPPPPAPVVNTAPPIPTVLIVPTIGPFVSPGAFLDNPEPSTGLLLLTGVGLMWFAWRRKIKA
jgi:hypothetical protein